MSSSGILRHGEGPPSVEAALDILLLYRKLREAPVCSRIRRKRTVAIKQLIKRDSARRMCSGSPFRPGEPVNCLQMFLCRPGGCMRSRLQPTSAAMPSVACVGRHSNGFCLFRGDRKWLLCPNLTGYMPQIT